MNEQPVTTYAAVYTDLGYVRRIWFEAPSEEAARSFCVRCGAGLQGPAVRPANESPPPAVYDIDAARALLGNVSRATIRREVIKGRLARVPNLRKVLITRESLEKWGKWSL